MTRRRITLLATAIASVALAAALAAGCGGSSDTATKEETQQAVSTARNRVDLAYQRMARAEDLEDFAERMAEASESVGDAADELGELRAPEPFAEDVEKLVASLEQLSVDLGATAADLTRPELLQNIANARGINFPSWDRANAAIASLNEHGLQVEELERY
jgi:methylphosphotriester-DNA--protein-cysteine methyltransferase